MKVSSSMSWSFCRSLFVATIVTSIMVTVFPSVSGAESPTKQRGLCAIHHPSDASLEWDCSVIPPGKSLEMLFGKYWVEEARFNRIDRRHARPGLSIKVPRRLEDLASITPLPLFYKSAEADEHFILIDLAEQFLGAYEFGALRFSMPIASGNGGNETPTGEFRLTAAHRHHHSCLYTIEGTSRPYPMNHALRFYVNREGVSYWIHGRDMPGYPASHGCIGLYDEPMQTEQYGIPEEPELNDAKKLFEWVLGTDMENDNVIPLTHGPQVHIIGRAPRRK